MFKKIIILVLVFSVSVGLPCAFANGDDLSTEALLKRIEGLEQKVDVLNDKPEGGLVKALKDINLSGFVDTGYTYNFNAPDSRVNTARVFDTEANNFNLHAAKLVFEKLPPDAGGAGFRTDLFMGQDAEVITPTGSTRDQFDLEQAYISLKPSSNFKLPLGDWHWIKIGKFVTMHGAEVIEAKDNWNFSRSLLFGYAIPFTHTGIRAGYKFSDSLSGYAGLVNGWDNVKDNNKTKSGEAALAWAANDKLSFNLAGMLGPEQASNDHSQRGLIDFLATYKPFNKWTFMLNGDYGYEQDLPVKGKNSAWSGVAAYAKYDLSDKISLINRTEFMSDRKGQRITSGTEQDLWETTMTLEVRPFKDMITRLEYRHDESSSEIFTANQKASDKQDTFGAQMIYSF